MRGPVRDTILAILAIVAACVAPAAAPDGPGEPPPRVAEAGVGNQVAPDQMDDETLQKLLKLQHTEEEEVRLVLLPVTVTNRAGRPIQGLGAQDFSLREDNIPQKIDFFSADFTEPVHVAFLLDISGSMRQLGKLEAAKQAIRYFVDTMKPNDEFALICFADEQVAWITDFTSDRKNFLLRLSVQEAFGQTALSDAVAATPKLVDEKIKGRKAIVLFTDGVDNASKLSDWQAIRLARSVNVPIYSVGFTAMPDKLRLQGSVDQDLRLPATFSRETGGLLFQVHDPDEVKEAAATILGEIRFQYLVGYYPTSRAWDGRFRRIELEARRDSLQVRTRNGYYARSSR